ncbi:GNAT family N-acetyltransferase [Candidatus Woesearchaeota archaeon]|nr:GNAT family N-acetyltransferase [Candidatus Woesearchaeota archaeon]
MNVTDLASRMLESPGRQFDVGKAITLALEFPVYLGKPEPDIAEVVARCDGINVGFAMLFESNGELLIENPMWTYCRPNLEYLNGVGIEVHPDFRGRGIAAAMLSAAIAVTRSRFKSGAPAVARSAVDALEFYRAFGFDIIETPLREGVIHYGARYVKPIVPEIMIR